VRVRMIDIANRVGVSRVTVSLVLNGRESEYITDETRRRVLQTAREMGCVRNAAAHALAKGCAGLIGVWVPELAPYYVELARVVGFVEVTVNSPGGQGQKQSGPDDLIRVGPAICPDPLLQPDLILSFSPQGGITAQAQSAQLKPGQTQPIWLTVTVPYDAEPGIYRSTDRAFTKAGSETLPVSLRVSPVTIPAEVHFWMGGFRQTGIRGDIVRGVTGDPGDIVSHELFTRPAYGTWLRNHLLRNPRQHRSHVVSDLWNWGLLNFVRVTRTDEGFTADFSALDRIVGIVQKALNGQFRLVHCDLGKGKGPLNNIVGPDGAKMDPKALFPGVDWESPRCLADDRECTEYLAWYYRTLQAHLTEKGWLDRITFCVTDEAHGEMVGWSLECSRYVHEVAPGLRLDETVGSDEALPMLNEEHLHLYMVNACFMHGQGLEKSAVERVPPPRGIWGYNNFRNNTDLESIHGRMVGWVAYKFGHTGFIQWAYAWAPGNTQGCSFGPGEIFLVCPPALGQAEVTDSPRWEMLRDAAEDYELLWLLEQAGGDPRAYCDRLVTSAMAHERASTRFFSTRRALLEELSQRAAGGQ